MSSAKGRAIENENRESGARLPGVESLLAPLRPGKTSEVGVWRPEAKRRKPTAALPAERLRSLTGG